MDFTLHLTRYLLYTRFIHTANISIGACVYVSDYQMLLSNILIQINIFNDHNTFRSKIYVTSMNEIYSVRSTKHKVGMVYSVSNAYSALNKFLSVKNNMIE